MSTTAHTPGPWFTGEPHFGRYGIYSEHTVGGGRCKQGRQSICIAHYEGKGGAKAYHDMFKANARLIAAAPELLEALQEMVAGDAEAIEEAQALGVPFPEEMLSTFKKARAAIARATGEPA